MLHPRMFMQESMELVEKSKEAGHLLMSGEFGAPFKELPVLERIQLQAGFTNHPAFVKLDPFVNCYRLKEGYSASKALNDLLTQYAMVVDCGLAQLLAYYLSILIAMQRMHGKTEGAKRFDHFFGSDSKEVPENRRLLLSPEGPIMGTSRMPWNKSKLALPLQPLSFIFELLESDNKQEMQAKVKIGSMLMFSGDPDYLKVHPRGSKGGHNCVVSKLNPLRVRTFNHGYNDFSEEDLIDLHMQGYREEPSDESTVWALAENLAFQKSKKEADRTKIIGFACYFVDFKENALISLFITPLDKLEVAYKAHVLYENRKIEQVLSHSQIGLLAQAMQKLKTENDATATQAAEPALSSSQTFTPQASAETEKPKHLRAKRMSPGPLQN